LPTLGASAQYFAAVAASKKIAVEIPSWPSPQNIGANDLNLVALE
jgi:hypothetical protein